MKVIPPVSAYRQCFELERIVDYPVIDAIEDRAGAALDRGRLEAAAKVLACPVKARPPNWQHGRMLYAVAWDYLLRHEGSITILDIGTAKGFSALCLLWACQDAGRACQVVSVDVIDPRSHARRNTVAECDGLKTLAEILEPWPEAAAISFEHETGIDWLSWASFRVHIAYIDGKHDYEVVREEARLLAALQAPGDVAIFDDVQIAGVARAVGELDRQYAIEYVQVLPARIYAIGVRR
jgi:predicted O-methyltransferase YrrM